MVKGTGYMPPNPVPATNPAMLKDFYAEKPNHLTSLSQQSLMPYGTPSRKGDNNLKIIQVTASPADGGRQVGGARCRSCGHGGRCHQAPAQIGTASRWPFEPAYSRCKAGWAAMVGSSVRRRPGRARLGNARGRRS